MESVLRKEKKRTVGRTCESWARKSDRDVDDESIESSEEDGVTSKERDELELERLVWSWQRDTGSSFQRQSQAYWKEQSVSHGEDDVGGWASVTRDKDRVLREAGNFLLNQLCHWKVASSQYSVSQSQRSGNADLTLRSQVMGEVQWVTIDEWCCLPWFVPQATANPYLSEKLLKCPVLLCDFTIILLQTGGLCITHVSFLIVPVVT